MTKWQWIVCPGSAKSTGARAIPAKAAVVAQGRDFDDITVRINGVARARTSQINLPGIASVANVDRSAISVKRSIYSGAAIGAGCQNGHFPTGTRRSRIEQGKKLPGVG